MLIAAAHAGFVQGVLGDARLETCVARSDIDPGAPSGATNIRSARRVGRCGTLAPTETEEIDPRRFPPSLPVTNQLRCVSVVFYVEEMKEEERKP